MDFQENPATGSALKDSRKYLLSCLTRYISSLLVLICLWPELVSLSHLQHELIVQTWTESPEGVRESGRAVAGQGHFGEARKAESVCW